ncbi:hypothetical protein AGMMS50293_09090 [Spirochaetia bacterium]|nr:hypothetical protein AGMMS50293_09090 [Spirochaetia bacterium]
MQKNDFISTRLTKGEINHYHFKHLELYVYKTNDPMNDITLILKKDKRIVVIEPPCFTENLVELEQYLHTLDARTEGLVLAYHMTGAHFMKEAKRYSTRNAEEFGTYGPGKAMVNDFSKTFGSAFDSSINKVTDYIDRACVSIAGIEMNIEMTHEAFDIEIPEINLKYMHLLGHDVHSIIISKSRIDTEITKLTGCIKKGYDLICSSHYPPEDTSDVRVKIGYLKKLKSAVAAAKTSEEFIQTMKKEFPNYGGDHYLEMTAHILFGKPA